MNLPNKLSLFRVAFGAYHCHTFLTDGIMECFRIHTANGDIVFTLSDILVFVLFAVASFTDFLMEKLLEAVILLHLLVNSSIQLRINY